MPWMDGGLGSYDGMKSRLDLATRVACEMGQMLTEKGWHLELSDDSLKWLREHQKQDKKQKTRRLLQSLLDEADNAALWERQAELNLTLEEYSLIQGLIDDIGS